MYIAVECMCDMYIAVADKCEAVTKPSTSLRVCLQVCVCVCVRACVRWVLCSGDSEKNAC